MRSPLATLPLLAILASAPAVSAVVDVTVGGAVTGYSPFYPTPQTIRDALPVGTSFAGTIRFESDLVASVFAPASGTVTIGALDYQVVSAVTSVGTSAQGFGIEVVRFRLAGPGVAALDPARDDNLLSLVLGIVTPDPLAAPPSIYPYTHLSADVGDVAYEVFLSLPVARVALAPVPEPTSWALMVAGFGAVGTGLRARRRRAAAA